MLLISKPFEIPLNNMIKKRHNKKNTIYEFTCANRWLFGGGGAELPLFLVFFKYLNLFV